MTINQEVMEEQILAQALERALPRIAVEIQNELRLIAPVDKGRLRNSIKVRPTTDGIIIGMVDYGKFIEFGTIPYVIYPNKKQALKFKEGNDTIFAKKVNHPAIRPNPFIRNTLRYKLPRIVISNIVRELNNMVQTQ